MGFGPMCKYLVRLGSPFTDPEGKMTEVELDPSKEEIEKTCIGLVWLDKRNARYPARRLLHPVPSMAQ